MADINYNALPQKTTPSVAGDFVIITDSEDGGLVKIQDATQFKGIQGDIGNPGANAPEVDFEYSIDGSTLWHTTFVVGDKYIRNSTDGGTTWSDAMKFIGEDGVGDMLKSDNLSGLINYTTARTNLGLNTTANQTDSTDKRFMTDAQETKLDGIDMSTKLDKALTNLTSIDLNTITDNGFYCANSTCTNLPESGVKTRLRVNKDPSNSNLSMQETLTTTTLISYVRTTTNGGTSWSSWTRIKATDETKEPLKGTDDNYVTDAEKVVIGNTSNTNSGDNATNSQYSGLATSKQDTLVSGTNIKTINGSTILGSGDLVVSGGGGGEALKIYDNNKEIFGLTDLNIAGTGLFLTSEKIEQTAKNWSSITSAADNEWRGITYGNGLFVAVAYTGTGNRVMTSPDGITWTIRTSAADNGWYGVTYGNGLFVAIASTGTGNRVMTSPDGITWTIRTSAADNGWSSVTYGNGLFVAVASSGTGNRVMTSPDGITWTIRTSAADNNWRRVIYGNGLFVTVATSGTGNRVMTSPDGITWTIRTSAADNSWNSVTYGNGLFVTVASTGTGNRVMTSPDGITWTIRTNAADNGWSSVTYGNGLFVAVANTGTGNRVMTSPDGITWTSRTSAANNEWFLVTYGNGLFVAVANTGTGNRVMISSY